MPGSEFSTTQSADLVQTTTRSRQARRFTWKGTLVAQSLIVLAAIGCGGRDASKQPANVANTADLPKVSTAHPVRKNFAQKTEQPGTIEAFASAPIHAKVSGYVKAVLVDIGDRVEGPKVDDKGVVLNAGSILAVIDAPELVEAARQAEAKVAQAKADARQAEAGIRVAEAAAESAAALAEEAKASVDEAQAGLARWRSESDRIQQLAASKTVTQKLADETEQQFRAANAALTAATARVRSAESKAAEAAVAVEKSKADADSVHARLAVADAEVRAAQVMVDYLTLRAPFSGVIVERNVDPGRLVQTTKGPAESPLFTVVQADTVRFFIEVPEADAVLVQPGRQATIRVAALGGHAFPGTVSRTSWSLASSNRTLRTEIDIPNAEGMIRPGMFAQVELVVASKDNALIVPKAAVILLDGQPCCLAVDADGTVSRRDVTIGLKSATEVEIVTGLTDSDEVIIANTAAFQSGQKVAKAAAK